MCYVLRHEWQHLINTLETTLSQTTKHTNYTLPPTKDQYLVLNPNHKQTNLSAYHWENKMHVWTCLLHMHNQHFPLSTLQEKHNTNSTFPVFSQTISYCVFFIIPEYFTDIFLLCSFKDTGMLFKNIFI